MATIRARNYGWHDVNTKKLERLLSPRSIAFVGGAIAEMAIRRNLELGYEGDIWPVHPTRKEIAGFKAYPDIDGLPGVPDSAFVALRRELTVDIVKTLADAGAGGCVCYAAGVCGNG